MANSTTRRTFLQTATATAAASTLPTPFIHADDKSGSKLPVVGEGEYQYECLHDWGMDSLPDGASYGNASHGVAVDSQGLIYITHKQGRPGSIFVFDPDGKFVKSMGDFHALGNQGHGGRHRARDETAKGVSASSTFSHRSILFIFTLLPPSSPVAIFRTPSCCSYRRAFRHRIQHSGGARR